MLHRGRVTLVGAGPGDPELVTVRGLHRLQSADVVVYDRLVSPELVDAAPAWAERIYAGKQPSGGYDQRAIEALLIDRARAGSQVVRLKGGDPFVFGRGGEEVMALLAGGIEVEIVPGVTSAIGVPGLAGIPVTHRGLSSSVTIVTAHEDPHKAGGTVDWDWLAAASGTMVILMGLQRIATICARLVSAGRPATTPAAVIASGSMSGERVIVADLGRLPTEVSLAGLRSPATIVVGEVARFGELCSSPVAGGLARLLHAPVPAAISGD